MNTYRAVITREDDEWLGDFPELDGASTYASTLPRLMRNLREVAILADDLPDDAQIHLELSFDVSDSDVVTGSELRKRRARVEAERVAIRTETNEALKQLLADGYSVRDAAVIVGVSPGRVSQLMTPA